METVADCIRRTGEIAGVKITRSLRLYSQGTDSYLDETVDVVKKECNVILNGERLMVEYTELYLRLLLLLIWSGSHFKCDEHW